MGEWQPIETVPDDQRVLLCNKLWDDTFGEVQIGYRQQGKWLFDSEMNINDGMDDLDADLTAADYAPVRWRPLPRAHITSGQSK